jgi:predicted nucleic acid-binding protein
VRVYLDTSALVSLYYPEQCSGRVAALVAGFPLPFSHLHELEAKNALMLKVYRREAGMAAVGKTMEAMGADLKTGSLFRPPTDWMAVFRDAVELAVKHSQRLGFRSLDVLHVTLARSTGAERFVSLDERQKELARRAGLRVARV